MNYSPIPLHYCYYKKKIYYLIGIQLHNNSLYNKLYFPLYYTLLDTPHIELGSMLFISVYYITPVANYFLQG